MLVAAYILLCPLIPCTQATTLQLATDDTPGNPWIIGGGLQFNETLPGIEIELYRLMAARLGLKLDMVRLPWKRCLLNIERGLVDGIFPASFKPERLAVGVYPMKNGQIDPLRKSRDSAYYLYTQKTAPLGWDGNRFVNLHLMDRKTIGVPLGWSIASDLRTMGMDLLEKPMPEDLLEILNRGGLAGVVCLDTVMDTYLVQRPNRFSGIRKNQPAVTENAYYLMLSHPFVARHPVLSENIWDTIAAIKNEGTFKAVMERYLH
ncbi:hypothetical protein DSCW_35360 [Desulfosarcina widdelii]|uniref:Solute-binding protein family 3/N-terminal domain-containing protein n=1 Tax=Desulfosarcina widdelii TaxID=947919 RepID=A0A5K7Z7I4_9BACT|nr:transporter substrate-binding domain-containing protein [Desulfosarcina widdelii]BBO76119.1 hypothetical protein DSCW_35360 [Desulfosarcina widdelii]